MLIDLQNEVAEYEILAVGAVHATAVHVLLLESKQVPAAPIGVTVITTEFPAVKPETV